MSAKDKLKKAGDNTWVRAKTVGIYGGERRKPDDLEPFQLRKGDGIVGWMEEVDVPASAMSKTAKVKNAPRNTPEPQKPNGDQQPGDETGNATAPSTAQSPAQVDPKLA